ncbi:MAG: hypothetical protein CUN49_02705 [Candidatus Thermofonsia Clade 1 bacterium]|uniref:Uncharacterized protein n=1 Tax=Candidatus Thermofonsia Clade 1 bacterium TaxID=2364210 RepID=A0A2M8Q0Z6_9CHLR|nr:MAG: hypothetical protein CUN49_02705 [Candidatus Thermofonsia Clade 1 bacterium]PJF43465.1 MAG: hypothetical protein CUN50_00205 [Candidatus Thermofonsia Clade 1 bacterium]RMF50584.1 MAG: hypothetical protein D6749_10160 [Chloroflexota bacterium]
MGLYYYVRVRRSGEVVRIRINPNNDLSLTDDESGYFVRKVAVGTRSFERVELEVTYDKNRRVIDVQVQGGDLVDQAAYEADQAAQAAKER